MKIIVFSDSHGTAHYMSEAVRRERPDMLLYLGDGLRDLRDVTGYLPEMPVRKVKGNNDFAEKAPDTIDFTINGRNIFMTHGHLFGVHQTYENLKARAKIEGADIVIFGHTHSPCNRMEDGLLLLNPGSMSDISSCGPYYALLEIDDAGKFRAEIKTARLENNII